MFNRRPDYYREYSRFFYISCINDRLIDYYQINFQLIQHHKYSLEDLENMIPWEREIYLGLLKKDIEEENIRRRQESK